MNEVLPKDKWDTLPPETREFLEKYYAPPNTPERKVLTEQAWEKLKRVRSSLVFCAPFFGYLRCFLKTELRWPETWGSGPCTAFTDSRRICYNPMFVLHLSHEELAVIEIHETLHVALQHCFRGEGRVHLMWNLACDYVVNQTIQQFIADTPTEAKHWKMPEHYSLFIHSEYSNMSADQIYADLFYRVKKALKDEQMEELNIPVSMANAAAKNPTKQKKFNPTKNNQYNTKQLVGDVEKGLKPEEMFKKLLDILRKRLSKTACDDPQCPKHNQSKNQPKKSKKDGTDDPQCTGSNSQNKQDTGKGVHPENAVDHVLQNLTMMYAPVREAGESDEEFENMGQEWLKRLIQGYYSCKGYGAGHIPGSISGMINDFLKPTVDWKVFLKQFITESSKGDYDWRVPNRYYLRHGFYLPALYSKTLGEVIVCIDTSGSCAHVIKQFISEAVNIFSLYKECTMTLIECDCSVQKVMKWKVGQSTPTVNADGSGVATAGFGGTSFVPPFEYIREKHLRPKVLIYLTDLDGYGDNNGLPPKSLNPHCPVLWVCINDRHTATELPFGSLCVMEQIEEWSTNQDPTV